MYKRLFKALTGPAALVCLLVAFFAAMLGFMFYATKIWKEYKLLKEHKKEVILIMDSQGVKAEIEALEKIKNTLKEKGMQLDAREALLLDKEKYLKEIEVSIDVKKNEVEMLKEKVSKYIHEINENELSNMKRLANIYGKMKPSEVVSIVDVMSDDMFVMILSLMREKAAAKVLAAYAALDNVKDPSGQSYSLRASRVTESLRRFKTKIIVP